MRLNKKLFFLSFLMLPVLGAMANQEKRTGGGEPSVTGSVADADSKKPVTGVTVSISGKGLDKKETLTTDGSGNFKSGNLNQGEVTILVEKKGYRSIKKEGVQIKDGATIKLLLEIEEDDDEGGIFHPLLRMMDGL